MPDIRTQFPTGIQPSKLDTSERIRIGVEPFTRRKGWVKVSHKKHWEKY